MSVDGISTLWVANLVKKFIIKNSRRIVMGKVIFDFDMFEKKESANVVFDELTVSCMKYNYPEFVGEYGHEEADRRMGNLFMSAWDRNKEKIWQWFDADRSE
jgi:hypothetical protein|tara:strand:- start:356 stop:661 length:306 start_codon:yes stop_codon:yes gene_type:complete